jgi:hypothetical protein
MKISKNFAFELSFLNFIREFSDSITFFTVNIESDWYKGDHNPQFGISLIFLNIMILEFRIYNIHHEVIDDEK